MKALNARKSAQAKKLIPPNDPNEINDPKLQTASNKPSEMVALGSLKFNIEPNAKFTKTADAIVAGNRPGAAYEIEIRTNNKGRETNKTVWVSPSAG